MRTLLLLAPLPPPIGGATRNVELFLEEAGKVGGVACEIVNTSPSDYRKETAVLRLDTLERVLMITRGFLRHARNADAVLFFGRGKLIFGVAPILLLINILFRKPFYFKPFGGDLDLVLEAYPGWLRATAFWVLNAGRGVFIQTRQVETILKRKGLNNSYWIPGYRKEGFKGRDEEWEDKKYGEAEEFSVIFLGQVKAEKGVFELLEAVKQTADITCDFYGPLFAEDEVRFLDEVKTTPGAAYRGMISAEEAVQTITKYHALVLPTYFENEGHPGAIIEAMQAGVPVIATDFRAIGELVDHGKNGLLVPTKDVPALAAALEQLAENPALRQRLAEENYRRRMRYRSDVIVRKMLEIIFPADTERSLQD